MTHLCELCSKPAVYRFVRGFQMVACASCAQELGVGSNWRPVTEVLPRPDYRPIVDQWREQHGGTVPMNP